MPTALVCGGMGALLGFMANPSVLASFVSVAVGITCSIVAVNCRGFLPSLFFVVGAVSCLVSLVIILMRALGATRISRRIVPLTFVFVVLLAGLGVMTEPGSSDAAVGGAICCLPALVQAIVLLIAPDRERREYIGRSRVHPGRVGDDVRGLWSWLFAPPVFGRIR